MDVYFTKELGITWTWPGYTFEEMERLILTSKELFHSFDKILEGERQIGYKEISNDFLEALQNGAEELILSSIEDDPCYFEPDSLICFYWKQVRGIV